MIFFIALLKIDDVPFPASILPGAWKIASGRDYMPVEGTWQEGLDNSWIKR
jgi:hypothetical protein